MSSLPTPVRSIGKARPDPARRAEIHSPTSPQLGALREVGVVSIAIFLYFFVRGLMAVRIPLAQANAHSLVDFERKLGLFHEPAMQRWALQNDSVIWLINAIYMYGHWPVLIATMTWLIWKRRDQFPIYRSALLISGAIGLVAFVAFPMSPPRFLPELGFLDTVTIHTNAYRVLQPPAFTNQYAAMPSLHVGWNLLMGIAIYRNTTHRFWRIFAIVMPLAMYLATILTANHFVLDGIIGSLVALTGLAIALRISAPDREATTVPTLRKLTLGDLERDEAA